MKMRDPNEIHDLLGDGKHVQLEPETEWTEEKVIEATFTVLQLVAALIVLAFSIGLIVVALSTMGGAS